MRKRTVLFAVMAMTVTLAACNGQPVYPIHNVGIESEQPILDNQRDLPEPADPVMPESLRYEYEPTLEIEEQLERQYELIFNSADILDIQNSIYIPRPLADFFYALTDEQFAAIFPNVDTPFLAVALYSNDGSLIEVQSAQLEIRLSAGESVRTVITPPESPTQVSNIHGVAVTAWTDNRWVASGWTEFIADFMMDGVIYHIRFFDIYGAGQVRMEELIEQLILGGSADLSVLANPVIPEHFSYRLTLDEARLDPTFGAFVPAYIPSGFSTAYIRRSKGQSWDYLHLQWDGETDGSEYIRWEISPVAEERRESIIYRASLPNRNNEPIFLAEEFTLDSVHEAGIISSMEPGWFYDIDPSRQIQIFIAVLHDDVLVFARIFASVGSLSSEQIWAMFS